MDPIEVRRGLVMRFSPEQLMSGGAEPPLPVDRAVRGPHYFICIGRSGRQSVWTPAFSRWLPGRSRVGYKGGSADWTGQPSFVDLEQLWIIGDQHLNAGTAGVDRTGRGNRNLASTSFLFGPDDLAEAV